MHDIDVELVIVVPEPGLPGGQSVLNIHFTTTATISLI